MKFYIYCHTCHDGRRYFGFTENIDKRWSSSGTDYRRQPKLKYHMDLYGWDSIKHEVLLELEDRDEALNVETALINYYETFREQYGLNIRLNQDRLFEILQFSRKF